MNQTESPKALVHVEKVKPTVNSDTLHLYLLGHKDFQGREVTFDPHLILAPYSTVITDLREHAKQFPARTQEEKEAMYNAGIPLYPEVVNPEASMEISRAMYVDMKDGKIKTTDFTLGGRMGVAKCYPDIYRNGNLPVIEAHTHPINSLPSSDDYLPLLYSFHGQRLLRGIIIVCPTVSILALATPDTPLLDPQQADALVKRSKEFFDEDRKIIKELKKQQNAIQRNMSKAERRRDRLIQNANSFDELQDKLLQITQSMEEMGSIFLELGKKGLAQTSKAFNTIHIDFARRLNIKLYVSFNDKDFITFSA